jgi:hypothetical protein
MAAITLHNVVKRYGKGPKINQVIHLGLRQINFAAHGGGT